MVFVFNYLGHLSTKKIYALRQLINWKLASAHSTGIAIWYLNTLQIDQNIIEHTNIVLRLEALCRVECLHFRRIITLVEKKGLIEN